MAKAKAKETKERAAVGKERRLALALVGLMDAYAEVPTPDESRDAIEEAETAANELLNELGYSGIESTTKRIARINEELTAAFQAGDGKRIAELGNELEKAKAGKFHRVSTDATTEA